MLLNDKAYAVIKSVAMIWLPGLGTLYFTLAHIWNLPAAEQVTGTVVAVDTFLGLVLGLSSKAYNNSDNKYDGEFIAEDTEEGTALRLKSLDYSALNSKNELLFKVGNPPTP